MILFIDFSISSFISSISSYEISSIFLSVTFHDFTTFHCQSFFISFVGEIILNAFSQRFLTSSGWFIEVRTNANLILSLIWNSKQYGVAHPHPLFTRLYYHTFYNKYIYIYYFWIFYIFTLKKYLLFSKHSLILFLHTILRPSILLLFSLLHHFP